jgi:TolA-binding protein
MADPEHLPELERVLALARQAAAAPPDPGSAKAGRAKIVAAATRIPRERRSGLRAAGLLAAAAVVLAAAGAVVFERTRLLRYDVVGAESAGTTDYVSARPDAPAEVRFSDGSEVIAAAGARVRVDGVQRNGARLILEKGAVTVSVRHRAESSWRFGAGPYDVHVTGTKFRLSWDPEGGDIDLSLDEGSVDVESRAGPKRVEVHAGQRFHASARQGSMQVENVAPPSPEVPDKVALSRDDGISKTEEPKGHAAPPNDPRAHEESWLELARRGQFEAIVSAAKARGLDACFHSSPAADLRALADAARYAGDAALAEKSLEALRARFAGTSNGRAAAFLLGRTHESTGDLAGADRWYRVYLSESPGAELAPDALAGRIRVLGKSSRRAEAKALAEEYLAKYPNGVDVGLARKLAGPD